MTQRKYAMAMAASAKAALWRNREMGWEELCSWASMPRRTPETAAEYAAMPKAEQRAAKDGTCFVAGRLQGGRRSKGTVASRSMVVLDADASDAHLMGDWELLVGCRALAWPTHSSRKGALKHRLVVPLSRDVTADEYVPLAMKLAETVGMSRFDVTTFQPERLMYAPSAPADAPFELLRCDGDELDPDEWLSLYPDWRDASCWPVQPTGVERRAAKAPDPRAKKGAVGAFCRAYGIEEAIEEFLDEAYEPAGKGRYTYRAGSSYAGVVCYDGLWAYSNHATDPAGERLCNAFDLVRIHRFGELDDEASDDAPITALPSYRAMCEWAGALEGVSLEMARAAVDQAADDFGEGDDSWKAQLAKNAKTGAIEPSSGNIDLILRSDEGIAGKLCRDVESRAVWVRGEGLPWRTIPGGADLWSDEDDAQLRGRIEAGYGIVAKGKIEDAVSREADSRPYDPLRERLEGLPAWDGVPRLDTLLIDALGAEDSEYVRQATRKTLAGAVKRALEPGCKWDYMLILEGEQGLGKSSVWEILAGERFFTDSLTLRDVEQPKVAGEKVRGKWVVEVAELDGMAKASIERLKGFLTTKADNYRAAYARRAASYKRRCIIVGTVNNLDGYLRDATGNRRFWPVRVTSKLDRGLLTSEYVDQVWAEAKAACEAGEALYLEGVAEAQAEDRQREAMEADPREGIVRAYLEAPVPPEFRTWGQEEREAFWDLLEEPEAGWEPRSEVTIMEIWHEALRQPKEKPTRNDSYQISAMLKRIGWRPAGQVKRYKAYGVQRIFRKEPREAQPRNRVTTIAKSSQREKA